MAGANRIGTKGVLVLLLALTLLLVGPFVVLGHIGIGKIQSIGSSARGTKKDKTSSTLRTTTTIPQTTTTTTMVQEPGGGVQLFLNRKIVAYYGLPGNPTLGVLGTTGANAAWAALNAVAQSYATPGVKILPAFELITYVAQGGPGPDGTYSKRIPNSVIQHYLSVVRQNNGLLILDIQPGRGSLLKDAQSLAPYLSQPDVALAIDPEWEVSSTEVPGKVIGHTTGEEINALSKWLQGLTIQNNLPQKLLLVHQFKQSMVVDKWATEPRSNLSIVFNMDGFGSWGMKVKAYQLLEPYTDFGLGFKLFYHQDLPLGSPQQVMALVPQPNVIEYQ